jgi:hypothetical protein
VSPRVAVWTSLMVVGLLAVGVLVVDQVVPPPQPGPDAGGPAVTTATGGAWTCAVGDSREGTELTVSAIGPPAEAADPGQVQLGRFGEGELDLGAATSVAPGSSLQAALEGEDVAAFARWYDHPVGVYRHWRLSDTDDLPPGRAAGPCLAQDSDRWWIPGMSTAGGHEARLRLANPYDSDATVAIRLVTPEGPVEPTVLQNFTVLGRSSTEIEINEHLPERDDVAVEVRVVAGRVAAEGYQLVRQAIGDVDGVSLLASAAQPSTEWTVPWVAEDDDRYSWLWLLNPGDRPAPVELTLHGSDGGVAPEGLAEVTVEPGQVRRIDLRGTLPEDLASAAVTARSEGVGIVASGAVRIEASDPSNTGMATQLGAQPGRAWMVAGGATEGRSEQLRLVNAGAEPAVVDVALWDGGEVRQPDELSGIEVPPGSLRLLDLVEHLDVVTEWSAIVEASQGALVVGHVGQGGAEARELVAGPGLSSAAWEPTGPPVVARHVQGLTQRVGLDPQVEQDPLEP